MLQQITDDCLDYLSTHIIDPWNHLLGSPISLKVRESLQPFVVPDEPIPYTLASLEFCMLKWQGILLSNLLEVKKEMDEVLFSLAAVHKKRRGDVVCIAIEGIPFPERFFLKGFLIFLSSKLNLFVV
jgi:hypothetical protein